MSELNSKNDLTYKEFLKITTNMHPTTSTQMTDSCNKHHASMYAILETPGGGVVLVLTDWVNIDDQIYYWPGNSHKMCLSRKTKTNYSWSKCPFVNILKSNIVDLSVAQLKLKMYSNFTDSEAEARAKTKKRDVALRRDFNNLIPANNTIENTPSENRHETQSASQVQKIISPSTSTITSNNSISSNNGSDDDCSVVRPRGNNLHITSTPSHSSSGEFDVTMMQTETGHISDNDDVEMHTEETMDLPVTSCDNFEKLITPIIKAALSSTYDKIEKKMDNHMELVNKNLSELVNEMKTVKNKLKEEPTVITLDPHFVAPIPISKPEKMILFNEKLENQDFREQMVVRLKKLVVSDINRSVKNIMDHCFPYSLISKYSWSGQAGLKKEIEKLPYCGFKFFISLIQETLNYLKPQKKHLCKKTAAIAVKEYLKRASTYYKRSKPRI